MVDVNEYDQGTAIKEVCETMEGLHQKSRVTIN